MKVRYYIKQSELGFDQSRRIFFHTKTITLYLSMLLKWIVTIYEKCRNQIKPRVQSQASNVQSQPWAASPLLYYLNHCFS